MSQPRGRYGPLCWIPSRAVWVIWREHERRANLKPWRKVLLNLTAILW